MADVPESLEKMLATVGEKTGCKLSEEVQLDDQGTHQLVRSWACSFQVAVERPSAHELLEASVRLKEMLEATWDES